MCQRRPKLLCDNDKQHLRPNEPLFDIDDARDAMVRLTRHTLGGMKHLYRMEQFHQGGGC